MSDLRRLSWLHISDLHVATRTRKDHRLAPDQEICWKSLEADIAAFRCNAGPSKPVEPPDIIVLSGDIVQAGASADAFELAHALITRLCKAAAVKRTRVFIIPGNHDIAQNRLTKDQHTFLNLSGCNTPTLRQTVDTIWNSSKTLSKLERKFQNYLDFSAPYAPVRLGPLGSWRARLQINGLNIDLVGLNSVWTGGSRELDRPGMAVIGRSQREFLYEEHHAGVKSNLTLVLQHSPTSYLHSVDALEHASWLDEKDAVVFCGHLHQSEMAEVRSMSGRRLELLGGALYPGYAGSRRYSMGTVKLDTDERRFVIALRSSDPENNIFERDLHRYAGARDGVVKVAQDLSAPANLAQEHIRHNDQLVIDVERARLRYDTGKYYIDIVKTYRNPTKRPISHIDVLISMMALPDDPVKSRELYRDHPLDLKTMRFEATYDGKPADYWIFEDHDSRKDLYVIVGDGGIQPSTSTTIEYRFEIERRFWGPFFERHIRRETGRIECELDFPQKTVRGFSLVLNKMVAPVTLDDEVDKELVGDRAVYRWAHDGPRLQARYRFMWAFLAGQTAI
jgi:predicted MPP superfamily phosphohydrolase